MDAQFRAAIERSMIARLEAAKAAGVNVTVTLSCGHTIQCVNVSKEDRQRMARTSCPTCCGVM